MTLVSEFETLIKKIMEKRAEIEKQSEVLKSLNKDLTELKGTAVAYLNQEGKSSYKGEAGTVSIRQKWNVTVPKTAPDKKALFDWLKEENLFEQYATVNSISLNSLYKSKLEDAEARGEGMGFSIPGVQAPTLFEDLAIRKK